MPFCPQCGLNVAEAHHPAAVAAEPSTTASTDTSRTAESVWKSAPSVVAGLHVPPVAVFAGLVLVGLLVLGFLPRLPFGGTSQQAAQSPALGSASIAPAPPIVGLTILSPSDGQSVATKDVVVIGTAPPGLTITQDVSFGLDNHTKADGTGHWAMTVSLGNGDNRLTFRIGDDKSTSKTIRVIYTSSGG
jgi:hypothetical protein